MNLGTCQTGSGTSRNGESSDESAGVDRSLIGPHLSTIHNLHTPFPAFVIVLLLLTIVYLKTLHLDSY